MIKRFAGALLALVGMTVAADAASLLQGGPWVPGRAPMYSSGGGSQPVVQDSGPAGGGAVGLGLAELLLVMRGVGTPPYIGTGTGPLGANFCDYDAPITNPTGYHYLCWSPNATTGHGVIEFGAGGGAAATTLDFVINGIAFPVTSVTSGLVTQNQMREWASANGSPLYVYTITNACPADIADQVNIQWEHGNSLLPGDTLYLFIQSTLGFSPSQMTAAYISMQSYPQ